MTAPTADSPTLTDRLRAADPDGRPDPDAVWDVLTAWVGERGLTLYPAQEEAILEVLAGSRAAAKSLIESIDAHLLDYPHSVVISSGPAILDTVTVPVAPASRPWDSPSVRRFAGTYQFSVRR